MRELTTLRERNKAKRRDAIVDAAIRLFADQGYNETTIAEIAAVAEVAPRTVSLHFPAKLDIVRADIEDAGLIFAERLAERTDGETVLDIVVSWLRQWLLEPGEARARYRLRMYTANDELSALVANRIGEIVFETIRLDPALSADIGDPADQQIVGAALSGVMRYLATIEDRETFDNEYARVRLFFAGGFVALRGGDVPVSPGGDWVSDCGLPARPPRQSLL